MKNTISSYKISWLTVMKTFLLLNPTTGLIQENA